MPCVITSEEHLCTQEEDCMHLQRFAHVSVCQV